MLLFPPIPFNFYFLYAGLTSTWNSSYILVTNSTKWITVDVVVTTEPRMHHIVSLVRFDKVSW